MNPFKTIAEETRRLPKDERQTQVRYQSSYAAFFILAVAYLILVSAYTVRKEILPWSTQLLFLVTLLGFAYNTLRDEGAHFRIPWVKETATSLNQPTALRSLPWLTFITGIVLFPVSTIASGIGDIPADTVLNGEFGIEATFFVVSAFIGFLLTTLIGVLLARWIKEGRAVVIWIMHLVYLISLPGYAFQIFVAYFPGLTSQTAANVGINVTDIYPPVSTAEANLSIINITIALWAFYVLLRYSKRMIRDGKAYQEEVQAGR